jgi:penicillin-binding protein 2
MNKLGKGFADAVTKGKDRKGWPIEGSRIRKSFTQARVVPFFVLFVFGIGILIARLFWVTVVRGNYYRKISEENRVREEIAWAPRGIIYDRNKRALVLNRPIYRRAQNVKGKTQSYQYFTQEEALKLEADKKGRDIELFVSREYPFGESFAHIIGYVGEADENDVEGGLRLGSLVGKSGLEESFDSALRGEEGKVLVETDAYGKKVKELGKIEAKPGKDIYTTLDAGLQKRAAEILRQAQDGTASRPGAVIVSRPNGEILVLYSSPSFDPNIFVGNGKLEVEEVLKDPSRPLFNRAIGGLYPPGSTFKIITAAAALEEGEIDKNSVFFDKGFIRAGSSIFRNWYYTQYGKTEGKVDIIKGIARSVDTYFYRVGEKVGIDNMAEWARNFGLGRESGIDIAGEAKGRMPDKEWKLEAKGERWYLGDTYHAAIGQGDILVTPLQVNLFTGVIANGGRLCKPRILKSQVPSTKLQISTKYQAPNYKQKRQAKRLEYLGFENWDLFGIWILRFGILGRRVYATELESCTDLGLGADTLELIRKGMRKACEPGGTGFPFFDWRVGSGELKKRIPVACKTGTAEYGNPEKTHAWFTVFAPVEKPEIVVTVLLEGGGSGAYDAAPIAKGILGEYFSTKLVN